MRKIKFKPQLTPKKMLELGVFGGYYFEGNHNEYPKEWLKRGWVTKEDPLGWFQWYCRYTMRRRIHDVDNFQINRWAAFGPRHIGGIKANCVPEDIMCRPRQRQALLHWAYDPFI